MTYAVKEIFYTLQGEGRRAGRPAVFCRFAGCNLWTGREVDRDAAICRFCDTDFVGTDGTDGGKYRSADALATRIAAQWPGGEAHRYVVLTGGEPLLQVDPPLVDALHRQGFEIAVETNGSIVAPPGIDWLCVSPKAGAPWVQRRGNELKLAFPQPALLPETIDREAPPSSSTTICSSRSTIRPASRIPRRRSTTASSIRAGTCRSRPTRCC